jgi:hypothetical protein
MHLKLPQIAALQLLGWTMHLQSKNSVRFVRRILRSMPSVQTRSGMGRMATPSLLPLLELAAYENPIESQLTSKRWSGSTSQRCAHTVTAKIQ